MLPEKCNKPEDAALTAYYRELRTEGLPFDAKNSGKYAHLTKDQFAATVYDAQFRAKSSSMAQFADLYLWLVCMGGYHPGCGPYRRLRGDGKLIACLLPETDHATLGTKYSCFEGVVPLRNQEFSAEGPDWCSDSERRCRMCEKPSQHYRWPRLGKARTSNPDRPAQSVFTKKGILMANTKQYQTTP